jgi:hypothetical protein
MMSFELWRQIKAAAHVPVKKWSNAFSFHILSLHEPSFFTKGRSRSPVGRPANDAKIDTRNLNTSNTGSMNGLSRTQKKKCINSKENKENAISLE